MTEILLVQQTVGKASRWEKLAAPTVYAVLAAWDHLGMCSQRGPGTGWELVTSDATSGQVIRE